VANFIAIDLDAQGLYTVAGTARGSVRVTSASAWAADTGRDPPPALTPETAKQLGEALRDRLKAAKVAPAPALVSVGRDRVILKELKYPPVPPTEEPALVRFQALKEVTEAPDEIVIDYVPLGEENGERRAMAVILRRDLFAAIRTMCEAAGLKLAGVTPRPYALAAGLTRAIATDTVPAPTDRGDAVAVLALGPAGGEFTVVRGGDVTYTLAVPAPVAASEAMLSMQLRRNLATYAAQHPGHPVRAVYVAEADGARADALADVLGVPVHELDPLAGAVPGVPAELRGRFAGAAGLLAAQAAGQLPINFAAPRQPKVESDPAKRKLALVALAAGLLLLVGGAFGYMKLGAAEARVADLAAERDELKKSIEAGAPDAKRTAALEGWQGREVRWDHELYELARRMPADDSVRVSQLTATPIALDKNGKQEAQALINLKLNATSTAAAISLMTAFENDNRGGSKYYVGTGQTILQPGGPSAGKHNQNVTVWTKVRHREPNQYTNVVKFKPPKRTAGVAYGSAPTEADAKQPEPAEEPEAAPPPAEKG
jgi:outer membrane murein-binding lipoprotein Lpp